MDTIGPEHDLIILCAWDTGEAEVRNTFWKPILATTLATTLSHHQTMANGAKTEIKGDFALEETLGAALGLA